MLIAGVQAHGSGGGGANTDGGQEWRGSLWRKLHCTDCYKMSKTQLEW